MKASFKYFAPLFFASSLLLAGCSGQEDTEESSEKTCFYEYNSGTTVFEWTAFKFADKSGPVPGGFNDIEVQYEGGENPKDVIESISFSIATASVETQNEDRNKKIAEFFFGTIGTETIEGEFKELRKDGKAVVTIKMNGASIDVIGDYTLEGADFTFETTIDVSNWNALSGIKALNTVCEELHRKAPGEESKLWSEVVLKLSTTLKSDC
jgi:polyisoprenoid-binding protein YceI